MNKVYLNKTHLNILKTFFNKNLTYEKLAIVLFDINTYEKETNFNIKYIITPPPKAIIESNDFMIRVDPRFYKYYIRYSKEKKLGFISMWAMNILLMYLIKREINILHNVEIHTAMAFGIIFWDLVGAPQRW
ncbi:hypothetical protein [Clostridium algidicarnis]|nr:hypothetical protein [Clostridium algidicarnis]MBU3204863.1 hypothetical protein [Clostridium algidicarnis]MBU3213017.1 hypothetical protein [Clostridium algidicarnis]